MTPTCGNCKFWEQQYDDFGLCSTDDLIDESASSILAGPSLLTGRYFGCIHFSAKTDTAPFTMWVKRQDA